MDHLKLVRVLGCELNAMQKQQTESTDDLGVNRAANERCSAWRVWRDAWVWLWWVGEWRRHGVSFRLETTGKCVNCAVKTVWQHKWSLTRKVDLYWRNRFHLEVCYTVSHSAHNQRRISFQKSLRPQIVHYCLCDCCREGLLMCGFGGVDSWLGSARCADGDDRDHVCCFLSEPARMLRRTEAEAENMTSKWKHLFAHEVQVFEEAERTFLKHRHLSLDIYEKRF